MIFDVYDRFEALFVCDLQGMRVSVPIVVQGDEEYPDGFAG